MPVNSSKIWALAEAYIADTLSAEERQQLETRLSTEPGFQQEFQECLNVLQALDGSGRHLRFRTMLQEVHGKSHRPAKQKAAPATVSLKTHYWRTVGVAAGIAILTSVSTIWAIRHMNDRIESQYSLLRRDLETYKRSQNLIIKNIKDQNTVVPAAPAKYGGTGFALTNDGYLVTNYHVTEGADSIYIQNKEGLYFRASLVGFDQKTDIAVLKVDDPEFRFAKGDIPYSFAPAKRKLGSKIFSLGFPQEEIVYNEGYISAVNGYNGDTLQYRLELPASPGQSGAPIVDASGNVIGIVTGKKTKTSGTTYAVSSGALLNLIPTLVGHELTLPGTSKMAKWNRERQIENLELYTCSIKVYKQ